MARIKANIRRTEQYSNPAVTENNETLSRGDLVLNLTDYTALKGGKKIELTAKEFEILKLLMQNPKRFIPKSSFILLSGRTIISEMKTRSTCISAACGTKLRMIAAIPVISLLFGGSVIS